MPKKVPPCDFPIGELNNVRKAFTAPTLDPKTTNLKGMSIKRVVDSYTQKFSLTSSGKWNAIVLRVEKYNSRRNFLNTKSGAGSYTEPGEPKLNLVKVWARIPELHAGLRCPLRYGDEGKHTDPHQHKISRYPLFVAATTDLDAPACGSIIRVSFGNADWGTDGVYEAHVAAARYIGGAASEMIATAVMAAGKEEEQKKQGKKLKEEIDCRLFTPGPEGNGEGQQPRQTAQTAAETADQRGSGQCQAPDAPAEEDERPCTTAATRRCYNSATGDQCVGYSYTESGTDSKGDPWTKTKDSFYSDRLRCFCRWYEGNLVRHPDVVAGIRFPSQGGSRTFAPSTTDPGLDLNNKFPNYPNFTPARDGPAVTGIVMHDTGSPYRTKWALDAGPYDGGHGPLPDQPGRAEPDDAHLMQEGTQEWYRKKKFNARSVYAGGMTDERNPLDETHFTPAKVQMPGETSLFGTWAQTRASSHFVIRGPLLDNGVITQHFHVLEISNHASWTNNTTIGIDMEFNPGYKNYGPSTEPIIIYRGNKKSKFVPAYSQMQKLDRLVRELVQTPDTTLRDIYSNWANSDAVSTGQTWGEWAAKFFPFALIALDDSGKPGEWGKDVNNIRFDMTGDKYVSRGTITGRNSARPNYSYLVADILRTGTTTRHWPPANLRGARVSTACGRGTARTRVAPPPMVGIAAHCRWNHFDGRYQVYFLMATLAGAYTVEEAWWAMVGAVKSYSDGEKYIKAPNKENKQDLVEKGKNAILETLRKATGISATNTRKWIPPFGRPPLTLLTVEQIRDNWQARTSVSVELVGLLLSSAQQSRIKGQVETALAHTGNYRVFVLIHDATITPKGTFISQYSNKLYELLGYPTAVDPQGAHREVSPAFADWKRDLFFTMSIVRTGKRKDAWIATIEKVEYNQEYNKDPAPPSNLGANLTEIRKSGRKSPPRLGFPAALQALESGNWKKGELIKRLKAVVGAYNKRLSLTESR